MTIDVIPDDKEEPLLPLVEPEDSFLSQLPDDASTFLAGSSLPPSTGKGGFMGADTVLSDIGPTPQERAKKRVKMSKKMQKMMDGFRDQVVDIPLMWFHSQAKDNPEWALDAKEEEFLKDAFGAVFEILDIEIQIDAVNLTLTSVWWVISYPFAAFLFLFLTHKAKVVENQEQDK